MAWIISPAASQRQGPDATSLMAHQAILISDFDVITGREEGINVSLRAASRIAAEGVGSQVAAVFQYQPDEQIFVLQAATGLHDCSPGRSWSPVNRETATGVAWHTGCPVFSGALDGSFLFAVPKLLKQHGVTQAVSVAIPGSGGEAFGVLEIGSPTTGHDPALDDIPFLRLLAQRIGSTVGRQTGQTSSAGDAVIPSHGTLLTELRYLVSNEFKGVTSLPGTPGNSSSAFGGFEQIGRRVVALAVAYAALEDGTEARDQLDTKLRRLSRQLLRIAEGPPSGGGAELAQVESDGFYQQDVALRLIESLTGRQRQILTLVLEGHPSKNIAADLGISQRTVENHRASIMARTSSKSLPALARMAFIAGGCLKKYHSE